MPAGSNPALARAIGVMLKNAWLQALLMRPAQMKESPSRGLSRNGVKNYSKGPCVTILE